MFVVKFIRNDYFPDEMYFYEKLTDAQYHYSLFDGDDSCLYCVIQLIKMQNEESVILSELFCGFTAEEVEILKHYGKDDQFETAKELTRLAQGAENESKKLLFLNTRIHLAVISSVKYPVFYSILKQQGR